MTMSATDSGCRLTAWAQVGAPPGGRRSRTTGAGLASRRTCGLPAPRASTWKLSGRPSPRIRSNVTGVWPGSVSCPRTRNGAAIGRPWAQEPVGGEHLAPRREAGPEQLIRAQPRSRLATGSRQRVVDRATDRELVVALATNEKQLTDPDPRRPGVRPHADHHPLGARDVHARRDEELWQRCPADERGERRRVRDRPWQHNLLRPAGRRSDGGKRERRRGGGEQEARPTAHRVWGIDGSVDESGSFLTGA